MLDLLPFSPTWVLVGLCAVLIYMYLVWPFSTFKKLGIPGPKPVPLFGHYLEYGKGCNIFDQECYQKYNKVYGIFEGRQPILMIGDLDLVKAITVKGINTFTNHRDIPGQGEEASHALFFTKDEAWKRSRIAMSPAFSTGKLKQLTVHIERCADGFVSNLAEDAKQGKDFNVKYPGKGYGSQPRQKIRSGVREAVDCQTLTSFRQLLQPNRRRVSRFAFPRTTPERQRGGLNIDIAALQETRLPDSGSLKEDSYTFFWQGKARDEVREHGVGFAIRNTMLHMIEPPTGGTERILTLRLSTHEGPANLVCVYAPTLQATPEAKDQFYEQLDKAVQEIPTSEHIFVLGDFNARVGADNESWQTVLGHHGIGKMNDNGQRLLELCCYHNLCVTNTFFQNKAIHKASWRHPRSQRWHQLDLVITRRTSLNSVCNTRSYHSADCDTDHSLVASRITIRPKRLHHTKKKGQPRIDVSKTSLPNNNQKLLERLEESLNISQTQDAEHMWESLSKTIHRAAVQTYGKRERKNTDWFEAHISMLEPIIDLKRKALLSYKQNPSSQNLQALKAVRHKAQQTSRRCANNYWLLLSERIQFASDSGNIRKMYEGIKQATGKPIKKCAPLKASNGEILTDKDEQMARWVEHYLELYSTENSVSQDVLDNIEDLPVIAELDAEPTLEELSKAIDSMQSGKAPGEDNIPAEVIKCGKPVLLKPLHELLCLCWKEGQVPRSMRNSKIITLYKNKGDRTDCNSYRGISLLSIVGKVFAKVALRRLQVLADRVYPESQCGFRAQRSTTDMIFSVRQLQEKCREQQRPLYIAFIDLTKAFDLVSRRGLFQLLQKIGCPPQLLSIIISFHEDMQGVVSYDGETSEPFAIRSGVKQGCVLAPTLFGIFFSLLLNFAFGHSTQGVHLHTRSDGKLFNLARLRAKTKVRTVLIRELLFADDAALSAHVEHELQQMLNQFAHACREFALTISIKKTVVMGQDVPKPPVITIGSEVLEVTDHFTYLGSTVTSNLSLDKEIDRRIARAAGVMTQLGARVWDNNHLTLNTKLKVYRAC
ncbi:CYP3A43, partial [Branchiostoma lanceolatum]